MRVPVPQKINLLLSRKSKNWSIKIATRLTAERESFEDRRASQLQKANPHSHLEQEKAILQKHLKSKRPCNQSLKNLSL